MLSNCTHDFKNTSLLHHIIITRAESSLRSGVSHYYNISRTILMIKSLKIVTYVLYGLVLRHVMQFWNFYLVFLSGSQCQGIAPCYASLELIDFLEISHDWRDWLTWLTDLTDIVSSRDPPDLKMKIHRNDMSTSLLVSSKEHNIQYGISPLSARK